MPKPPLRSGFATPAGCVSPFIKIMRQLTKKELEKCISEAEHELKEEDERAIRLWQRIQKSPVAWSQEQYPGGDTFWVIAIMGSRCPYYNHVEGGWGWGKYTEMGKVCEYHWQQLEIQHVVLQTIFAIDNGGQG